MFGVPAGHAEQDHRAGEWDACSLWAGERKTVMTGAPENNAARVVVRLALALTCCAPAFTEPPQTDAATGPESRPAAQSGAAGSTLSVPPEFPAGITPAVHESIQKGLRLLATLQNRDGSCAARALPADIRLR